jgi:hypothetical protein
VDFDSGSSDFFLPGPNCNSTGCIGHKVYDPAASHTAVDTHKNFSTAFLDGSSTDGEIFTDTVSLAGLVATKQAVVAATEYSDTFAPADFPPDGLLGMAFPSLAETHSDPVFQTFIKQRKVAQPIFGFTLLDNGGELVLGGSDKNAQFTPLHFTPVTVTNPPAFWEINAGGVFVGAKEIVKGPNDAVVDTGTSLLVVDNATANAVYAQIPGSKNASDTVGPGFFTVPCDAIPNNVAVELANHKFNVSADTFNFGPVSNGSSDCVGGLMGGADGGK